MKKLSLVEFLKGKDTPTIQALNEGIASLGEMPEELEIPFAWYFEGIRNNWFTTNQNGIPGKVDATYLDIIRITYPPKNGK